jgi:hypothetical protein
VTVGHLEEEGFADLEANLGDFDVEVADLAFLERVGFSRSTLRHMPCRCRQRCRLLRVKAGMTSSNATKTSSCGSRVWT